MTEITTTEELRAIYRNPRARVTARRHGAINDHDRSFIAHSPLVMVGTADNRGRCDVSPRGGPPGFVSVLDAGTIAIPDISGNNTLDTLQNVLSNTGIGLLFLVPGTDEALRVNGRARLSTDPTVLTRCTIRHVVPRVAVVVQVHEVFLHCPKALRRGSIWHLHAWPDTSDMPTAARMLRDQVVPGATVEQVEQALDDVNRETMWQTGG